MQEGQPTSVLFVCNQNAIRSPMAAAYLKSLAKGRIFVGSAGLISGIADAFTEAVLAEKGIKLGEHEPKSLNTIEPEQFSLVIALTNKSRKRLKAERMQDKTKVQFWDITDPSQIEGRRDQVMDAYRIVRDDIERHILDQFGYLKAT